MRKHWIIWSAVTALFAAYGLAGWISGMSVTRPLTLTRGSSAEVELLRIFSGPLRASLTFAGKHTQRPELGEWSGSDDWLRTGLLRFSRPGAPVQITASVGGSDPILFEAMPKSAHGSGFVTRNLTASLSVEPGAWRWPPPDDPRSRLGAGLTNVRFEVTAVDDRLNGETVELTVLSQLGFKSCQAEVCWLGGWLLWPIFAVLQAGWAGILVLVALRLRAQRRRAS